jgi:DNA (cytosine-5)-methyltransferase 1
MENVGALVVRGLDRVLGSLAEIGYDAEWQDIRASDVGAPHRRERIWIVGYPSGGGCGGIARGRARPEPLDGYSRLETWADRDPNGGYAAKKQEICGGENAKPYGVCANVADSQSGESRKPPQWEGRESIGRGSEKEFMADSDSLRLEYSSQGQNNEGWREIQTQLERIGSDLADSDIINDDNSGHGASPVFGERSPEAEIPGSDPDADRQRFQEFIDRITAWARDPDSPSCRNGIGNFWAVEPNVGRVANGIPSRVGRLKCLGNAVVPQIPELIFMSPAFDLWRE